MEGRIEQLLAIDPSRLPFDERLDHLLELHALEARLAARKQHALAAVETCRTTGSTDEADKHWQREEVACLLNLSPGFAATLMTQAVTMVGARRRTLRLVESGVLSFAHARALVDACEDLAPDVADLVERDALLRAGSATVAQFRSAVRRAVLRHNTRHQADGEAEAKAQRRVSTQSDSLGMSWLSAYLETADAERIMAHVQARAANDAGDDPTGPRSADQRRADAFVALFFGDGSGLGPVPVPSEQGRRPAVTITVDLATLVGDRSAPGDLGGEPVSAAIARALAFDPTGRWRWQVVGAEGTVVRVSRSRRSGRTITAVHDQLEDLRTELLHDGTLRPTPTRPTRYKPCAAVRDLVVARDRRCRFPGCRRRAARCEIDHIVPFDGRNTVPANLQCLCPRHHHLKHEAGWRVVRRRDGTTVWITPTGRRYLRPPQRPG